MVCNTGIQCIAASHKGTAVLSLLLIIYIIHQASSNMYYTTIIPRCLLCQVLQDVNHEEVGPLVYYYRPLTSSFWGGMMVGVAMGPIPMLSCPHYEG